VTKYRKGKKYIFVTILMTCSDTWTRSSRPLARHGVVETGPGQGKKLNTFVVLENKFENVCPDKYKPFGF
jgi:hypothetical protein